MGMMSSGQRLAAMGQGGDTILAHINPQEAMMLKMMGGSGTINPRTGLPQFSIEDDYRNEFDQWESWNRMTLDEYKKFRGWTEAPPVEPTPINTDGPQPIGPLMGGAPIPVTLPGSPAIEAPYKFNLGEGPREPEEPRVYPLGDVPSRPSQPSPSGLPVYPIGNEFPYPLGDIDPTKPRNPRVAVPVNRGGINALDGPPKTYTTGSPMARRNYLLNNPDVKKADIDPWTHYTMFGKAEGRTWDETGGRYSSGTGAHLNQTNQNWIAPKYWDSAKYLSLNPDLADDPWAQANPLAHYANFGKTEGRKWRDDPTLATLTRWDSATGKGDRYGVNNKVAGSVLSDDGRIRRTYFEDNTYLDNTWDPNNENIIGQEHIGNLTRIYFRDGTWTDVGDPPKGGGFWSNLVNSPVGQFFSGAGLSNLVSNAMPAGSIWSQVLPSIVAPIGVMAQNTANAEDMGANDWDVFATSLSGVADPTNTVNWGLANTGDVIGPGEFRDKWLPPILTTVGSVVGGYGGPAGAAAGAAIGSAAGSGISGGRANQTQTPQGSYMSTPSSVGRRTVGAGISAATSYASYYAAPQVQGGLAAVGVNVSLGAAKGIATAIITTGVQKGIYNASWDDAITAGITAGTLQYVGGKLVGYFVDGTGTKITIDETGNPVSTAGGSSTVKVEPGTHSYWDEPSGGAPGDPTVDVGGSQMNTPYLMGYPDSPIDMNLLSRQWGMMGGRGAYGYDPNMGDPTAMIEPTYMGLNSYGPGNYGFGTGANPFGDPTGQIGVPSGYADPGYLYTLNNLMPSHYTDSPYWMDVGKTGGDPTGQIEVPPNYQSDDYYKWLASMQADPLADPFVDIQRPDNYASHLGQYRNLGENPWNEDPTMPAPPGMPTWSYSGSGPPTKPINWGQIIKALGTVISGSGGGGKTPPGGKGTGLGEGGPKGGLLSLDEMPVPEYMKKKLKRKAMAAGKTWQEYLADATKGQKSYYGAYLA